MRRCIDLVVVAITAATATGCASMNGYFVDRCRDAGDIVTLDVGTMGFPFVGVQARVGPLATGMLAPYGFNYGWHGGGLFSDGYHDISRFYGVENSVGQFICVGTEAFGRNLRRSMDQGGRGKFYEAGSGYLNYWDPELNKEVKHWTIPFYQPVFKPYKCPSYYTQIQVSGGVGVGMRIGFNPGELLDFLLGWTTLDIFSDDLEARRQREKAKPSSQPPSPGSSQ